MSGRWLVKVKGERDGELFKMHSPGRWFWFRGAWSKRRADETIRQAIARNGYIKQQSLEGVRAEIARRASAAADEVQLELNGTR